MFQGKQIQEAASDHCIINAQNLAVHKTVDKSLLVVCSADHDASDETGKYSVLA
jgi:hypothetical protein